MNPNKKNNIDCAILLYLFNSFIMLDKVECLNQSSIILFLIFRKLHETSIKKCRDFKRVLLINFLTTKKQNYNFISVFQSLLLVEIKYLIFNKKILATKKHFKNQVSTTRWVLKSEYFNIEFTKINFFILFDKLKLILSSKRILYTLFECYQFNNLSLAKKTFFKQVLFFYKHIFYYSIDKFVIHLINRFYILTNKQVKFKQSYKCLDYKRISTSFLLKVLTKFSYAQKLKHELTYWVKFRMKFTLKTNWLSIFTKQKKLEFLGFQILFQTDKKDLFFEGNLVKIQTRLYLLNYYNKFKYAIPKMNQYFRLKQFLSLIKLKLILQGLLFYYKTANNKKYLTLRVFVLLKISIGKVFSKKFSLKSKRRVFDLFKNDLSMFLKKSYLD